jgi:uncharacterized HAD superfamily protein
MERKKDDISIGIDVDGTLTEDKIDIEMFNLGPKELEKKMSNLSPKEGIDVLLDSDLDIYIITGRQERFRYVTEDWLDTYGIPYRDLTLFPNDFYRKHGYDIPKYAGLKLDIHVRKNLHMSLDDNEQVVDVFNKFGILTCKVDNDFREAFEKVLELRDVGRSRKNI